MTIALSELPELKEIGGIAVKCDVSDAASAEAAIKEANARNGTARILINCAGIGKAGRIVGREGPMPLGNYEQVIKINLIGKFARPSLAGESADSLPKPGLFIWRRCSRGET